MPAPPLPEPEEEPPVPDVPEPVPEVPPLPVPLPVGALAPPEEEPLLGALVAPPDAGELEEEPAGEEALVPLLAVVVTPVGPVAPVPVEALTGPEVGTVSGGEPEVSEPEEPLPPQAATPTRTITVASSARSLDCESTERTSWGQEPSGSIRRAQYGQSFRSFWLSWSHQLQKRRFSTAQGSSETVGASGRSWPTTSSGSPVSRST